MCTYKHPFGADDDDESTVKYRIKNEKPDMS